MHYVYTVNVMFRFLVPVWLFHHKLHHLALRQIAPLLPHHVGHWELADLPIRKPAESTSTLTNLLNTDLVQLRCHKEFTDAHGITATSWISGCVSKRASNSAGGTCPYTSYISDAKEHLIVQFRLLFSKKIMVQTTEEAFF